MLYLSVVFGLIISLAAYSLLRKNRKHSNPWAQEYKIPWADMAQSVFEMENSGSPENRMELALRTGIKKLGLSSGIISLHRGPECKVLSLQSEGYEIPKGIECGQKIAGRRIFCGEIKGDGEVLAIDFASLSEWRRHSAYQQLNWESYIGTRVRLDAESFLTVGFFNSRSREHLFSKQEKEFVNQLGRWIAAVVQREKHSSVGEKNESPWENGQEQSPVI